MARVEKVTEREAGLFGRFAYRLSRRRFGAVAEPPTVMAHHPRLLLGYGMMELAFERSNLVDEHLKRLAVLKAATMVGCEFLHRHRLRPRPRGGCYGRAASRASKLRTE